MTRPLAGVRVVVTRPAAQSVDLAGSLERAGAEVVSAPLIGITGPDTYDALDAALCDLDAFEWVLFASVNAVRSVLDRLETLGGDATVLRRRRLGAVGTTTASALAGASLSCDACPSGGTAEALVAAVGRGSGRLLFPRAQDAPPEPAEALRATGWDVTDAPAYRTIHTPPPEGAADTLARGRYDVLTFASPSAVRSYGAWMGERLVHLLARRPHPPIVSIGPSTSAAIRALGVEVAAEARPHTDAGLVDATVAAAGSKVAR